jgi:phage gp37-like protein
MGRLLLSVYFVFFFIPVFSQSLSHVTLSGGSSLSSFCFKTDQKIIIKISPDGKVLEWGMEMEQGRLYYFPGKLDPYMGRVDYYNQEADSAFRGKVKSIGTCMITYFGSKENEVQVGKIKTLGNITFDYYFNFENEAFRGKLKSIGSNTVNYYSGFENEAIRGKLKNVNNTSLSYYSTFDDKLLRGKVKNIGMVNINWYTSMDRRELQGSLKNGSYTPLVNGVVFILR